MTYKKGMSKSKFKNKMRNFWTDRWKYEKTPQGWVDSISKGVKIYWSNHDNIGSNQAINLLEDALDKLVLEKKLKKDEAENLKKMIDGTEEDAFIALSIMAQLKPKKFKTNVEKLSELQQES